MMGMGGPPPPLSKRIFDRHDKDGSGSIDVKELGDLCYDMGHTLSPTELQMAVKMLDRDGSGEIQYAEFAKWWKSDDRFGQLQLSEKELAVLQQATTYFKYFDRDGSGVLDRDEFRQCHADLVRNGLTQAPFETYLADLDTDGDGNISFNEYVDYLIRKGSLKVKVIPS